jgi:hypothetical protein
MFVERGWFIISVLYWTLAIAWDVFNVRYILRIDPTLVFKRLVNIIIPEDRSRDNLKNMSRDKSDYRRGLVW